MNNSRSKHNYYEVILYNKKVENSIFQVPIKLVNPMPN